MKKIAITTLLILGSASSALADDAFTGGFIGGEINSTKQEFSIPFSELMCSNSGDFTAKSSRQAGVAFLGGYGFDFAGDFIGQIEGKIRSGGAKTKSSDGQTVSKEDFNVSISYLQGYRISPQVLPYIKVGVSGSSFSMNDMGNVKFENSGAVGVGYGAGIKYAVNTNVALGVEYYKVRLKAQNSIKFKTDTIALNAVYRF